MKKGIEMMRDMVSIYWICKVAHAYSEKKIAYGDYGSYHDKIELVAETFELHSNSVSDIKLTYT